jgi:glycosyltransferase involved in cell wall biosynthesis
MKILVLSNLYPPDFIGGYELLCRQAVDALRQRGHDVRVLTSAPRCPVPSETHVARRFHLNSVYDWLWLQKVDVKQRYLCGVESHFINAHNIHALLTALEDFEPEVVYLHNLVGLGGLALLGCLRHLRVPWVWHLGDMIPRVLCSLPNDRGLDLLSVNTHMVPALVREFNRQVRGRYLACSERLIEEIEASGLRIRDQVELLPYWVHEPAANVRQKYLQGGYLRIATAGQVSFHKGMDILIASAARLRERGHERFAIDIYGRVEGAFWQAVIDNQGVGDKVKLKGVVPQAELTRLLGDYDVFAFPTWSREPFGGAPLEAATAGCIPVLAEQCGIAEWLVHGVHCLKTERTADGFARVFADILDGTIDLEPLGRRAAAVVRRDFHLDALMPRIERALAAAAREPRHGAGTPAQAQQLALLAEKLAQVLIHEAPALSATVAQAA